MLNDILEWYPEEDILKADGLDDAIIGIEESSLRLIYSKKKVINILVKEGLTYMEALEHFGFNIEGAYVGEKTPIWCTDDF
jgi:hypothetical protein